MSDEGSHISQERTVRKRYGNIALSLFNAGFEPIPLILGTKRPADKGWTQEKITEASIAEKIINPRYKDSPVGIRCSEKSNAIDVDIPNLEVNAIIRAWIQDILYGGSAPPTRVGQPPKALYPTSIDGLDKKVSSNAYIDDEGKKNQIEILATGQQYVAYAQHPGTGKEYRWDNGYPEDVGVDGLQVISIYDIYMLIDTFEEEAEKRGWKKVASGKRRSQPIYDGVDDFLNSKKPTHNTVLLKEILSGLSQERCDNYDDWALVIAAAKFETEGSDKGFDIVDWWSQKSNKYRGTADVKAKWNSFNHDKTSQNIVAIGSLINMYKEDNGGNLPPSLLKHETIANNGPDNVKKSPTRRMLNLVEKHVQLKHDADRVAYALIRVQDHQELWQVDSDDFRHWLGHLCFRSLGKVPSKNQMGEITGTLQGIAIYEGEQIEVHLRVCADNGIYYLDPCWPDRKVIQIGPGGWNVVSLDDLIHFRRTRAMRPLPMPEKTSCTKLPCLLVKHFNIDESEILLLIAILIENLRPDTDYLAVEFNGPPGSSKSTSQEKLRSIIDPNRVPLRTAPKDVETLFVDAANNHLVSLDNLSGIKKPMSDALCSLCTGGGYAGRKLYTNNEEVVSDIKRPIIFNGIVDLAWMTDLVDRSVKIQLQPIPAGKNRSKTEIMKEFQDDLPKILGALLDLFSMVLQKLPFIDLEELPRMADFAKLCVAITNVYGWDESLLDIYYQNRARSLGDVLRNNGTINTIIDYINESGDFEGTYKQLSDRIDSEYLQLETPKSLANALRYYSPALNAVGIEVEFDLTRRMDGWHVSIRKLGETASQITSEVHEHMNVMNINMDLFYTSSGTTEDPLLL